MICKGVEMEIATMTRERANKILADFPRDSKTGQGALSFLRTVSVLTDLVEARSGATEPLKAAREFLQAVENRI